MIDTTKIVDLVKAGTPQYILDLRKKSKVLQKHYFGEKSDLGLEKFDGIENTKEFEFREKLAISNAFLVDDLLRPTDSIWNAKGGSMQIDISESIKQKFNDSLKNIGNGQDFESYLKSIWFERLIVDPNGVQFLFHDSETDTYNFKAVKITEIKEYSYTGIDLNWILFEPYQIKTPDNKIIERSMYVDAVKVVIIDRKDGNTINTDENVNPHKFVPGFLNSSILNTNTGKKESPIVKQVDHLNSYLIKNSIKEQYQLKHFFPVYWEYETLCPTCQGLKQVKSMTEPDNYDICPSCEGNGKSNVRKGVNDVLILKKPEDGEPTITPPAGYVQPDLETMGEQRTELDWLQDKITFSHWGTTRERGTNETATGRFIDTQPVNNRLGLYADVRDLIATRLLNIWGKVNFVSFVSAIYKGGRRFVIESPDAIWKRYQDARIAKANDTTLNLFLEQFYSSEFQNDEALMQYYTKLIYVEPYPHRTIEEVVTLAISPELIEAKKYFPEWLKTVSDVEIRMESTEVLQKKLIEFSKTFNINQN